MEQLAKTLNANPRQSCLVAGIDEVGRGCLAGPVAAAAVILPASFDIPGLADSKLLSPAKRATLASAIKKSAVCWSLGIVWPARIDQTNILQATLEAMGLAAARLRVPPDKLLIDGNKVIPMGKLARFKKNFSRYPEQDAIIRGDRLVPAISAASILAKTFRDRLMVCLAKKWPQYGFERHKGYGTKMHFQALQKYGPSPLHRMTFRGVLPENPSPDWQKLF